MIKTVNISDVISDLGKNRIGRIELEPNKNDVELTKSMIRDRIKKSRFKIENDEDIDKIFEFSAKFRISKREKTSFPKGFILSGGPGNGKTTIAKMMSRSLSMPYIDMKKVVNEWLNSEGDSAIYWSFSWHRDDAIIIDDLGAEQSVKKFGNVFPIHNIIDERWEIWDKKRIPTIIVTNIHEKDAIKNSYEERTVSRIYGMCNRVFFTGRDHRQD